MKDISTDYRLGIVSIFIRRPYKREVLTVLKDSDPPQSCITASVQAWLGWIPSVF